MWLRAWGYPLDLSGIVTLIGGLVLIGLALVAAWVSQWGILVSFIAATYVLAFLHSVLADTANGDDGLPHWPDFSDWWGDVVSPGLSVAFAFFVAALPGLALWILGYAETVAASPWLAGAIEGFYFLYLPVGLLVATIYGPLSAVNPINLWRVFHVAPPAFLACSLTALLTWGLSLAVEQGLAGWSELAAAAAGWLVSLYGGIVLFRTIGLVYRQHKEAYES